MVVAAFIALQMFGLRQDQLVQSKLGASDQSRVLLERMGLEIRTARTWYVGNVAGGSFIAVADGKPQVGTAIQLYSKSDPSLATVYYFDTRAGALYRQEAGAGGVIAVAQDLTNVMAFQAEDYRGVVQTNRAWRNCIRVILEFAQFQYPTTQVGPGCLYDYYKLEFKVTPHSPTLP